MDRRNPDEDLDALHAQLLDEVLARTSGPVCGRAHDLLADDDPPEVDRELLALHLEGCRECRELAAVLAAVRRDLPGLADVRPDPAFADDVLAATLPASVRWRRRWRRFRTESWPRWVRRPRFAWEAAFALTLVLAPVFTADGSPLRSVGERAMALSRENPLPGRLHLEAPVAEAGERLESASRALEESPAVRWAAGRIDSSRATLERLGRRTHSLADSLVHSLPESLVEWGRAELGTFVEGAASFLVRGESTPSTDADATNDTTREESP